MLEKPGAKDIQNLFLNLTIKVKCNVKVSVALKHVWLMKGSPQKVRGKSTMIVCEFCASVCLWVCVCLYGVQEPHWEWQPAQRQNMDRSNACKIFVSVKILRAEMLLSDETGTTAVLGNACTWNSFVSGGRCGVSDGRQHDRTSV